MEYGVVVPDDFPNPLNDKYWGGTHFMPTIYMHDVSKWFEGIQNIE